MCVHLVKIGVLVGKMYECMQAHTKIGNAACVGSDLKEEERIINILRCALRYILI